jgi:DNA topoisomerase-1
VQVADLQRHRAELDPKFHYIADAPGADPKKNPSIVRFSRKTREHFLSSMGKEGWTTWSAYWVDGKWVEKDTAPPPAVKAKRRPKK